MAVIPRSKVMMEIKAAFAELEAAFNEADEVLKIMGTAEVAERMGWQRQHVSEYLKRSEARGFPPGKFPKPFQRISSGWLWIASDIEAYAIGRESKE